MMMREKREKRKSVVSMGSMDPPSTGTGESDEELLSASNSPYNTVHLKSEFNTQLSVDKSDSKFFDEESDDNLEYDKFLNQFERVPVRASTRRVKHVSNILKVRFVLFEWHFYLFFVIQVSANQPEAVMRGYLLLRKKANTWKKHWFVIKDNVLYFYKASEDVAALQTEVLLGWQVEPGTEVVDGNDAQMLFQIMHTGRPTYIFKADSIQLRDKWVSAMKEASVLK